MEQFVVERVWPAGRSVLVHRHGRIVREVRVVQHLEHLVATHRQEGRPHSSYVFQLYPAVSCEDFSLTGDLTVPFLLRKLLPEAMPVVNF